MVDENGKGARLEWRAAQTGVLLADHEKGDTRNRCNYNAIV